MKKLIPKSPKFLFNFDVTKIRPSFGFLLLFYKPRYFLEAKERNQHLDNKVNHAFLENNSLPCISLVIELKNSA